jgi:hypothetical protein
VAGCVAGCVALAGDEAGGLRMLCRQALFNCLLVVDSQYTQRPQAAYQRLVLGLA